MQKLIIILAGVLALFVFIQNSAITDNETHATDISAQVHVTPMVNTSIIQ